MLPDLSNSIRRLAARRVADWDDTMQFGNN
jgi:hypothetical protein